MSTLDARFQKRLPRKAVRGHRGWPVATIACYGPDLDRASKVAVGIIRREGGEAEEMRAWTSDDTDVRRDPDIFREIIQFIEAHEARTVGMIDGIIGCPHQEDIDHAGEWCPVRDFWKGRDRFTEKLLE